MEKEIRSAQLQGEDKIGLLTYAGICLDHDLHLNVTHSVEKGLSGSDVVRAIVRYVSADVPVLVHSMNPAKAGKMVNMLESAGFFVKRIPYAELDKDAFRKWLDEVRENYNDLEEA